MSEYKTYRVKSINAGANTKKTTWVRAASRREAERYVRQRYSRHYIASTFERTPPEDVDVHETPRRSEPADFGGGESTGVQDL